MKTTHCYENSIEMVMSNPLQGRDIIPDEVMTIFYQYIFVPIIFEVLTKFSPIIFVCQYHYHTSTFSFHRKKGTYFGSIRHLIHRSTQHCVIISLLGKDGGDLHRPARHLQEHSKSDEGRIFQAESCLLLQSLGGQKKTRLTLETYIS